MEPQTFSVSKAALKLGTFYIFVTARRSNAAAKYQTVQWSELDCFVDLTIYIHYTQFFSLVVFTQLMYITIADILVKTKHFLLLFL